MIAESTVATQVAHHAAASWAWYVVRASGIMSVILLVLLMLSGIGLVTGYTYKWYEPIQAWAVHRALGIALAFSVAAHIVFILFDKFVPFTIAQLLVPFLSDYKRLVIGGVHVGSIYVALGVLSFYALVLIIASSLLIMDRAKRTWKWLHHLSYLAVILIFFHALWIGTDFAGGLVRIVWIGLGIVMLAAIGLRLWRAGTLKNPRN